VGDALPPGRPAPVDRRRPRRDGPPVVGPAAFVVGPADARPVEAAEVEPGRRPPGLLGAERVVGAGAVVAGALPALRPDGERQARVPLHPSQLRMKTTHHTAGAAINSSISE
jgi:hypothetical protein